MPWKSRWTVDVPKVDLPTFIFGSQTEPLNSKPLIADADKPEYYLSHETYRLWCKRFALGLRKNGLQPGDRVLLFSGNTVFFPVVFAGTIMAEGVFTGANPTYVARELAYQLKDSGAKFLISNEASLATSLEAAESIGFPKDRIFSFDPGYDTFDGKGKSANGIQHWTKLLASPEEAKEWRWKALSTPEELDRTVTLNYSSGTTGVPKGVMIAHSAYVANSVQVIYQSEQDPDHEAKKKRATYICLLPMYHAYGQTYFCCTAPHLNVPTYVMKKFDFVKMLSHIQRYRITNLNLVPPIAVALAKRPEVTSYDLSSVESVGSGAAPLGPEPAKQLEARFGRDIRVKQGWGMTEVTCSMTGWHPCEDSVGASIGELTANCEAAIMGEDGATEMKVGERGEFWVRGPTLMKGYWRKPEATKDTMTEDGWLKTGDIAYRDEAGKIFIVDRKKELIKVKGNQVAPAELEGLLLDNDAVSDACVVGVTIKGEELPRAYVVVKEGKGVKPMDIKTWMDSRVARHKRLEGGVVFVDEVPKNPSGKILRKVLRDRAKEEVGDQEPLQAKL